jgi:hypothetical protein
VRVLLAITFGKSTSALCDRAVQLARGFASYRRTGNGKNLVHIVSVTVSLAHEATWARNRQLLRIVSGWRSAIVKVDGQSVRYWVLCGRLAQVKGCYATKVLHGAGPSYCSGQTAPGTEAALFGCRVCKGASRRVGGSTQDSWIQFGSLSPQRDSFRVDKAAIFRTLEEATWADACLFCLAFRWQRVRAAVDDLPEVIELGDSSPFEVKLSAINPKKALRIKPKERLDNGGVLFGLEAPQWHAEPPRPDIPKVRYADIAGQDAALRQIRTSGSCH